MKSIGVSNAFIICLPLWAATALANPVEHIGQAVHDVGRASGAVSASAGHSLAATGQLASGVIATPVLASGVLAVGAGSAAMQAGSSLMDVASHPIRKPLPVTDETISILPPNKALQTPKTPNN